MLYIRFPEHIHLLVATLYHLIPPELPILLSVSTVLGYDTINICLCLAYLTKHTALKDHSCCCKWQDFLPSHGGIIFHCTHIPHLLYSYIL